MARPTRRAKELASEGLQNASSVSILAGNIDVTAQMNLSSDTTSDIRAACNH